jgi:cation transport regulator ChaC
MGTIFTTKGDMEESLLEKREGVVDNDNEYTTWVEYWHEGELVHRSVHVTLKKMPTFAGAEAASFG